MEYYMTYTIVILLSMGWMILQSVINFDGANKHCILKQLRIVCTGESPWSDDLIYVLKYSNLQCPANLTFF